MKKQETIALFHSMHPGFFEREYIHYTHIEEWYAKLGYKTVLQWSKNGIL